jgi:hypothetical protein
MIMMMMMMMITLLATTPNAYSDGGCVEGHHNIIT